MAFVDYIKIRTAPPAPGFTYLASPYSHADLYTEVRRYYLARAATRLLLDAGFLIFSPIVYSKRLKTAADNHDYGFWMRIDLSILERADRLWVLQLEGWDNSVGVEEEITYANSRGIPITFLHPRELGILER